MALQWTRSIQVAEQYERAGPSMGRKMVRRMTTSTGHECPMTGKWKCSGCGHVLVLNKSDKVPPCPKCGNTTFTLVEAIG